MIFDNTKIKLFWLFILVFIEYFLSSKRVFNYNDRYDIYEKYDTLFLYDLKMSFLYFPVYRGFFETVIHHIVISNPV